MDVDAAGRALEKQTAPRHAAGRDCPTDRRRAAFETGTPFTAAHIGHYLLARRDKLPISKFTTHDLRRTVATMLAEMGIALDLVAAVVGHESGGRETRTLVRHYVRTDLVERKKTVLEAG
jgi:integrase